MDIYQLTSMFQNKKGLILVALFDMSGISR